MSSYTGLITSSALTEVTLVPARLTANARVYLSPCLSEQGSSMSGCRRVGAFHTDLPVYTVGAIVWEYRQNFRYLGSSRRGHSCRHVICPQHQISCSALQGSVRTFQHYVVVVV